MAPGWLQGCLTKRQMGPRRGQGCGEGFSISQVSRAGGLGQPSLSPPKAGMQRGPDGGRDKARTSAASRGERHPHPVRAQPPLPRGAPGPPTAGLWGGAEGACLWVPRPDPALTGKHPRDSGPQFFHPAAHRQGGSAQLRPPSRVALALPAAPGRVPLLYQVVPGLAGRSTGCEGPLGARQHRGFPPLGQPEGAGLQGDSLRPGQPLRGQSAEVREQVSAPLQPSRPSGPGSSRGGSNCTLSPGAGTSHPHSKTPSSPSHLMKGEPTTP